METIIALETSSLRLEFARETGALTGIYSKVSDWKIIKRAQLGRAWKMMLPLEGKRNNLAWSHLQPAQPSCAAEEGKVTFRWDGVTSEFGGRHNVGVTTVCEIVNDQAVFRMHIENNSAEFVENVYYPFIGDLYRPDGCERFSIQHESYIAMSEQELYPIMYNNLGTHSVDYPTLNVGWAAAMPPMSPYCLLSDQAGNGLYIGVTERRIEAATWHAEALPGWRNSMDFRLFEEDEYEGKEVYTRFSVGHLPFVAPGTAFDLLPFGMEAYKGSWADGSDCYTRISKQWNTLPDMPAWAKEPHSWLQIHINSPEDELRVRFTELPKIGVECAKYGVKAIQLVGWNEGGQDRGNPSHTPDPRLGTFEELKQAIAEIRAMGVKLILFAKFTWADQSNADFKDVYEPLAIKDPYGDYCMHKGYQYMTLTQVADVNTRRLIPMCFGSEEYLAICNREFQKCVDLGADGILFDECLHHSPTLCCFDESHGHRYGEHTYAFDEKLIDGFREIVKGKEFMIAGEAIYDFQHNYYDVSYARTWGRKHKPVARYLRPDGQVMTAVVGFNDRCMLNQCLMYRYIISYEPYNFKGMLSDYPTTVAYGTKMDALRTDWAKWFWYGAFRDKAGGIAEDENGKEAEHYAVFEASDGSKGMVVCNYDEKETLRIRVRLDNGQALTQVRLVDWAEARPLEAYIELPPLSAAAII